jgi:hypothetical protein
MHGHFHRVDRDREVDGDLLDDRGVEALAYERPQEHGPGQSLLHGLHGRDDETVGLGVPQQAMALLNRRKGWIKPNSKLRQLPQSA